MVLTRFGFFSGAAWKPDLEVDFRCCAGILEQSMGIRNRVGVGLSYLPASLHRLAESSPWNRFLGSIKLYTFGLWNF
jgi:hypothetical protein